MLKRLFLKIWKDSVWSKVIAATIIGLGILGLNAISAFFKNISFTEELAIFWKSQYELWQYCLLSLTVVSFGLLIKNNKGSFFRYNDETIELDRFLFAQIRSQLPSDKMSWVKGHGYSNNPFKMEDINLLNFIEEKDKADFEFLHPEIENLKKELISSLEDLQEALTQNIFGAETTGFLFLGNGTSKSSKKLVTGSKLNRTMLALPMIILLKLEDVFLGFHRMCKVNIATL